MDKGIVERRLAAVMAADVAGYSRLMGADEVGTLNALKSHRRELIDPAIAAHRGRLVKTTGDGLLVEFASVVDAVGAAVTIQRGMLTRTAGLQEDKRIVLRIGVNIGDIIVDGDDIVGDGVNVAARLEALCEPGGLCLSRAANEQIRDKIALAFTDLGEHTVKNIARAVGVFGLSAQDIAALPEMPVEDPATSAAAPGKPPARQRLVIATTAAAVLVLGVAGGLLWWLRGLSPQTPLTPEQQLAAALDKALPRGSPQAHADTAQQFLQERQHRALAFAPKAGVLHYTANWPTQLLAEQSVTERCQQALNEPCALLISDDALIAPGPDGTWSVRDMPRVHYSGLFDPVRIPALRVILRRSPAIMGYLTAPSPKAAAFHSLGVLRVVTGAASQRAAEEQSLRLCNDDPLVKRGSDTPCYLYAVGNQVVLPQRSTMPTSPEQRPAPPATLSAGPQPAPPATPPAPAPPDPN